MGEVLWAWLSTGVWVYAFLSASGRLKHMDDGYIVLALTVAFWPLWIYLAARDFITAMQCTCTIFTDSGAIVFNPKCPKHKPKLRMKRR